MDFSSIKGSPEDVQRVNDLAAREQIQAQRRQKHEQELIQNNATLPVVIDEVRVGTIARTRQSFLEKIFKPLIKSGTEQPYTLDEALKDIGDTHSKLTKLDIFREPIAVYINQSQEPIAAGYPTPLSILFQAKEGSLYKVTSGTEVGNSDGSGYASVLIRNIFGGAESLRLDARSGIKTRTAKSAVFTSPLFGNPNVNLELTGAQATTNKPWASHDEHANWGSALVRYQSPSGAEHTLSYARTWRQMVALDSASPKVRAEAGDSLKSAVTYSWVIDQRKSAVAGTLGRVLPYSGYYAKFSTELAGAGGLGGDVAFNKTSVESQAAIPLFSSNVSLSASLKAGLICPLPFGIPSNGQATIQPSKLLDRFQLGGPTDVRGFTLTGMGPRSGNDSLGGDVFASGGLSLIGPFPRAAPDTPFRWQLFLNAGRLVSPRYSQTGTTTPSSEKDYQMVDASSSTLRSVGPALKSAFEDMSTGLPTTTAGVGIMYAHPFARFELNFSVPLVQRQGERRQWLSFGVGMEFS